MFFLDVPRIGVKIKFQILGQHNNEFSNKKKSEIGQRLLSKLRKNKHTNFIQALL